MEIPAAAGSTMDPATQQKPGVLFSGYVFETTGYGTAARAYVHALHRASLNLSVHSRSREDWRPVPDPLVESLLKRPVPDGFHICHNEACDTPAHAFGPVPPIVLTTWETDRLVAPQIEALNRAREVWVPSLYNQEVFREALSVPVFHLPHPVHVPAALSVETSEIDRQCSLNKDDYLFVTIATWQDRKNLTGVIEAFLRAFPDTPGVKLLIKTSFAFLSAPLAVSQVAWTLKRRLGLSDPDALFERLRIVEARWPIENMEALIRRANCYVSLHRSEGWCYPLFDAACAGVPVIATGYAGPMDYLDPRFHHLVPYEMTPVDPSMNPKSFLFQTGMQWAEPDTVKAAELMRHQYANAQACRIQAEAGGRILRERYSLESIGALAKERLQTLLGSSGRQM